MAIGSFGAIRVQCGPLGLFDLSILGDIIQYFLLDVNHRPIEIGVEDLGHGQSTESSP